MNEQIKQMIYKFNEDVGIHWIHEDKVKFAELIIQECMFVLRREKERCNEPAAHETESYYDYMSARAMAFDDAGDMIQSYFEDE